MLEEIQGEFNFDVDLFAVNKRIRSLNSCDWFYAVGSGQLLGVERAASWPEAIEHAEDVNGKGEYGYYINELGNELRVFAAKLNRDKYNKLWGKSRSAVSKVLMPYLKKEVFKKLPVKKPSNLVLSGITSAFLEPLTLALLYGQSSARMDEHFQYFLDGHFPCGYVGKYPKGRLVVY